MKGVLTLLGAYFIFSRLANGGIDKLIANIDYKIKKVRLGYDLKGRRWNEVLADLTYSIRQIPVIVDVEIINNNPFPIWWEYVNGTIEYKSKVVGSYSMSINEEIPANGTKTVSIVINAFSTEFIKNVAVSFFNKNFQPTVRVRYNLGANGLKLNSYQDVSFGIHYE